MEKIIQQQQGRTHATRCHTSSAMDDHSHQGQQLHNFLIQLINTSSSSSSEQRPSAVSHATRNKQDVTHRTDAYSTIDVLLKVPWFLDVAAAGISHVSITPDGSICCCEGSSASGCGQLDQQQQQQEDTHAYYQVLLATTAAKLALHQQQQQQQQVQGTAEPLVAPADRLLLQQLIPQLLSCPAAVDKGALSDQQHWASTLCSAAVQLAVQGNHHAADLADQAVQQLASLTGLRPDNGAGPKAAGGHSNKPEPKRAGYDAGPSSSSRKLSLGAAASLAVLSGLLGPEGPGCGAAASGRGRTGGSSAAGSAYLSPDQVDTLLQCVVRIVRFPAGDLRSEVQAVLLVPLLAAAATGQDNSTEQSAYITACQQLLLAACGHGSQTAGAATGSSCSSMSSSQMSEALALICRLQPHMLLATQHSGACAETLSELLLHGVRQRDVHSRHRALHLITAAVQAGQAPTGPGFTGVQWSVFMTVYRAQEEHVLHLVEPAWKDNYPLLWQNSGGSSSCMVDTCVAAADNGGGSGSTVQWISVLLERAAFHSNVTMRRLGLASLFQLEPATITHLVTHGGWQQLQQLLLTVMSAFESDKLASEVAAGSAVSRQAAAVAALQQQLTGFLTNCLAALQHQQQQQMVSTLITCYLDRVVEVSERAPTAAVLLQALAAAAAAATDSSSSKGLCDLGSDILLTHIGGVLIHVSYLHPAYLRPVIHSSVLQLVPLCCSARSCTVDAALTILAAGGQTTAAAALASSRHKVSEAVAVTQVISWLQEVLLFPGVVLPAGLAAAVGDHRLPTLPRLQWWLQPLHRDTQSNIALLEQPLPQQKLLYSLGRVTPQLSDTCQVIVADAMTAAAAAVAGGSDDRVSDRATALAYLGCGISESLQQSATSHSLLPATATTPTLIDALKCSIIALLRHHRTVYQAGRLFSIKWAQQLMQLMHNLKTLQQSLQQLQQQQQQLYALQYNLCDAAHGDLSSWQQQQQQSVHAVVAAAESSTTLDQQFMHLVTAHIAAHAFDSTSNALMSSSSQTNLESCIQRLCHMQPAGDTSKQWQQQRDTGSSTASRAELTEQVLKLRTAVLAQLVTAAAGGGAGVTLKARRQVFDRCLQDLEWTSDSPDTLAQTLHLLLTVTPYNLITPQQQANHTTIGPPQAAHECDPPWCESDILEGLKALLNLLQPLVRDSRRLSGSTAGLLVKVFFHPALFHTSELRAILDNILIPFTLTHGGVRLSVTLMNHLCTQLLNHNNAQQTQAGSDSEQKQQHQLSHGSPEQQQQSTVQSVPPLPDLYLPHIVHMCAFSVFAKSVTAAAALEQQRCDSAVLLPARVVLCSHLLQLARNGTQLLFVQRLLHSLLDVAECVGPYSWLAGREAGQSSAANGIKVAVWQTLCLMAPSVDDICAYEVTARGWSCLLNCHMHSNIRPHVQLFMLCLFKQRPAAVEQYLLPALNNFATTSYQVTVSVIIVALFLLYEAGPSSSPHFMALLQALLPWAMHHRHAVRVPVQVLLHLIFSRHMPDIQQEMGQQATDMLQQMFRFLNENDETVRLRECQALLDLTGFSLNHETSLEGVFGVKESDMDHLCDGESDTMGLQWPLHVRDRLLIDVLRVLPGAIKAVGNRFTNKPTEAAAAAKEEQVDADCGGDEVDASATSHAAGSTAAAVAAGGNTVYQFRPQVQSSLFDDLSVDRVEALVAGRSSQPGLVVCASLLDNVPNLAGLCRTCESLSVEALVISNRSVAFTDAFKRQSVTSERWIRLLEVGVQGVATFLRERKAAGYTIIGVEQATYSMPLQSYSFPKCCVLLIGNEQNGIPVPLLPLLDVCLEIPMLGVTRSLNAHVSGAMVVWQYTQQHLAQ